MPPTPREGLEWLSSDRKCAKRPTNNEQIINKSLTNHWQTIEPTVKNETYVLWTKHWQITSSIKKHSKIVRIPSKICQKSIPDRWKYVLGSFSAPNHDQVGPKALPTSWGTRHLALFGPKTAPKGAIFGTRLDLKWFQNRTCEHRLAPWPSKNALRVGIGKKLEK